MSDTIFKALKKSIDNKLYTISDVMELQVTFKGLQDKNKKNEEFLISEALSCVKNILSTGELPHLNPDFDEYSIDGKIDDEKLVEYLQKNCYYEIQPLDVKSNYIDLDIKLKKIFLNLMSLSEEDLKKITYVKIKSFMGESEIGEIKKSLYDIV